MSLLKILSDDLYTIFPDYIQGSTNSDLYPITTWNVIGGNTTRCNSFSSKSETFNIQFSIFDDQPECTDLYDIEEEIEDTLFDSLSSSGNHFVEVKKQNTIGPRYLSDKEYYQLISNYNITLAKDK